MLMNVYCVLLNAKFQMDVRAARLIRLLFEISSGEFDVISVQIDDVLVGCTRGQTGQNVKLITSK